MGDDNSALSHTNPSTAIDPTSSIYYLHPSDNPGALITSVLLKRDNYTEWATELSNSIQAKRKLGFINGTFTKPTSEPDLSRWMATNSMLVGWIRTSIDPKIRSTVSFVHEAHKLWENLQRRFSVKNGVRVHQIREAINTCQQNGQSVIDYYGRLSKLWEELDNLRTTCSCTCEASADIEKEREEIRVHKFLFGLDESRFRNIRSQIIDEDPLPDINNVYSRVIREEQHNNTTKTAELKSEAIGFNVQAQPDATKDSKPVAAVRGRDPNRSCTHCSRKGHDVSECFLLHGFPEWWNDQKNNTNQGGGTFGSSQRGRGGRNSNSGNRGRGRSNSTRAISNNSNSTLSINNDQIAQLLQLLQQTSQSNISSERLSGKTNLSDIIIDT